MNPWQELDASIDSRAYFAAHAPADIPGWFQPELRLDNEVSLIPVVDDIADPDLRETARQWVMDGSYNIDDLHPILAIFQQQFEAYRATQRAAEEEYRERRYFEWRWFYADRMLESYAGRINRNDSLTAAAPEMLETLQGLLAALNRDDDGDYFICHEAQADIDAARAAIAKATGK